jgi:vitamin K-dependent gamma-carboxylase
MTFLRESRARLELPVDSASLCALRLLFGLVMAGAAVRFLAKGWVSDFFTEPGFHFAYAPFLRVAPLPGHGMQLIFVWLVLAAFGIAFGFCYRFSAISFFVAFVYVELIEKALYLNHYYLATLVAGLLTLLPAGRAYSFDAWRKPSTRISHIPAWVLYALRFQVGLVYFFAGLAKLNADWLLEAQPLRIWLSAKSDWPLVGPLLAEPLVAYLAAAASALFDLGIVLGLLCERTMAWAVALLLCFHLATGLLFPIGIFPLLMTVLATICFTPGWPRRWVTDPGEARSSGTRLWRAPKGVAWLLAAHCAVQAALPLRTLPTSSASAWTREGFNFSWKVMVSEKAGSVSFRTRDRLTGQVEGVEPSTFLKGFQTSAMAQDPDLILQAARFIAQRCQQQGRDVAVYADAVASLNGRPARRLIDPSVDLALPLPGNWITELDAP